MTRFSLSPANFIDWQRQSAAFEGMAAYRFRRFTLTGGGAPESLRAAEVGPDFFKVVRAQPALGRTFIAEEHVPSRGRVVVISEAFWKSHLGAAPDAAGRTLTLDGETCTVVGVMPARFSVAAWGATAQPLWVPLASTNQDRAVRENHYLQAIARLKPAQTSRRRRPSSRSSRSAWKRSTRPRTRDGAASQSRSSRSSWATSGRRSSCCSARWRSCC